MPGHACFGCRTEPSRSARAVINQLKGVAGAYWTCPCGSWSYVNQAPRGGGGRANHGQAKGDKARGADGSAPSSPVLGDWRVVESRKPRKRGSPARAVGDGQAAARGAARQGPGADQDADDAADTVERVPDEDVGAGGKIDSEDEGAIEKLIEQLGRFAGDAATEALRERYEARLRKIREASAPRNPAVQLLRAQKVTRRKAKQAEAAREKVRGIERRVEDLLAEAEKARKEVEETERAEEEAKKKEEDYRREVAGGAAGPDPTLCEETVRGLQAQIAALPAAARCGNIEDAHKAIVTQLEALARAVARDTADHGSLRGAPAPGEGPTGGHEEEGPLPEERVAAPQPEEGVATPRPRRRSMASGRRGTSPGSPEPGGEAPPDEDSGRSRSRDSRHKGPGEGRPPGQQALDRGGGRSGGLAAEESDDAPGQVWKCPIPGLARARASPRSLLELIAADEDRLRGLDAPPVVALALDRTSRAGAEDAVSLQVYTDGSGGTKRPPAGRGAERPALPPAWAVVVVAVLRDGSRCLAGIAAAPMPGHAEAAAGAASPGREEELRRYDHLAARCGTSSFAAELFAALWALLWATSFSRALGSDDMPIGIFSDAKVGTAIATGHAGSKAERNLGTALRGAALAAGSRLSCTHVFSHVGHPFNEMADSAASAASRGEWLTVGVPDGLEDFLSGEAAGWAWLGAAGEEVLAELPPIADGHFTFVDRWRPPGEEAISEVEKAQGLVDWSPEEEEAFCLELATANILSASPDRSSEGVCTGRLASLALQMARAGIQMVGIQESRIRSDAPMSTHGFHILCSAADARGNYGVQLWVADSAPVDKRGLQVVGAGPRHMVVASSRPGCHIVVAHAPSAKGVESEEAVREVRAFWDEISSVLGKHNAKEVLLLADANAELGSITSDAVGGVLPALETAAGDVFHTWLLRWGVALPATFLEQEGDGCSWMSPSGEVRKRLDYVGVPRAWMPAVARAWVDYSIDMAITKQDHWAVRISVKGVAARSSTCRSRGRRYDLGRLRDPEVAEEFKRCLRELSIPRWQVDPDTHASRLAEQIEQALERSCPRSRVRPRQPWVSELAASISAARSQLLRAAARAHRREFGDARRLAQVLLAAAGAVRNATYIAHQVIAARDWSKQPGLRRELAALAGTDLVDGAQDGGSQQRGTALPEQAPRGGAGRPCAWQEAASGLLGAVVGQAQALHKALGRAAKRILARDRNDHVIGRATTACRLMSQGRQREAYKEIRAIRACAKGSRRQRHRAAPRLELEDGSLATSAGQAADRWLRYFGGMELASYCSASDMVAKGLRDQARPIAERATRVRAGDLTCDALIPLGEIEGLFRAAKAGKAPGPDGIANEVLAAAPIELARAYFSLFTKIGLRIAEPIVFKGGRQVPLWKGRGVQSKCPSSRQILLSSAVGKTWHRGLRGRMLQAARSYNHDAVFSLGSTGVDMAAHLPRAAADWAASKGLSAAVLFVDVVGAHYHAIRELVVTMPAGASATAILDGLRLSQEEREEMAGLIAGEPAMREAGVQEHVAALAAEALSNTWFAIDGASGVACTRRGSRPGDPLADVVYAFLAARCLRSVRAELRAAGLIHQVAWNAPPEGAAASLAPTIGGGPPPTDFVDIEDGLYADDDAFIIIAPASQIVNKTAEAAAIVTRGFRRFGLSLNFGAGKTEAVCRLAGVGAKAVERALDAAGYEMNIPGVDAKLKVVSAYKHMGSVFDRKGAELPEVSARRRATAPERKSLRPFFQSSEAPVELRLALAASVCVSILLVNAGTWSRCGPAAMAQLEAEYDLLIRAATRTSWDAEVRVEAEVLRTSHGLPSMKALVIAARLRYFGRLMRSAPRVLMALLQAVPLRRNRWAQGIMEALQWMRDHCPSLEELPPPSEDLEKWEGIARDHPAAWQEWVKRSIRNCTTQERLVSEGRRAENGIIELAFGAAERQGGAFECGTCGKAFDTERKLHAHMAGKHGMRSGARAYADGTACRMCLLDFHTRPRLIQHLAYNSKKCLEGLRRTTTPLEEATVSEMDAADTQQRADLRAQGRYRYWAGRPPMRVLEADLPPPRPAPEAGDWGAAEQPGSAPPAEAPLGGGDEEGARESAGEDWGCEGVPAASGVLARPLGSVSVGPEAPLRRRWVVIAHLFSGPRRRSDVQDFSERLGRARGMQVIALSVDILFGENGDLTDDAALASWRSWCRQGIVAGFVAGPPCNTWSRARMQSQPGSGGPRPVRTAASPWAKTGLTRSETQAVSLANSLLAATLWWFAELLVSGGAAIIEHPACWEERAAIWRLPAVRALQRSKDVQLVTFDQCMFGSPARAPTSLLCLRAPLVAATMGSMEGRGRCTHGRGAHEALTGKDERGVWRTARKRAYRPPLCHLMADALLAGLGGPEAMVGNATDDQAREELPDGLRPFAQELPGDAPEAADDAYADLDGAGARREDRRQEVWRRRREREVSRAAASDAFIAALMQEEPSLAPEGAGGTAPPSVPRSGGADFAPAGSGESSDRSGSTAVFA